MEIKPDLSDKDTLLHYLDIGRKEVEESFHEASSIAEYIDSRIGGKEYWQVSYPEICWLYTAVKHLPSSVTVETGVGPGTSSTAILTASRQFDGRLYSVDLGKTYGQSEPRPVGFIVPDELSPRWKLNLGDSKKILPELMKSLGEVDLFFHDSEHTYEHVTFELKTALPHLRKRFLIVVDNYDWTDAPQDFSKRNGLNLLKMADDMCFIFPGNS